MFDGMGGAEYGEVASLVAAEALHQFNIINTDNEKTMYLDYFAEANKKICNKMYELETKNMGTTACVVYIDGNSLTALNVGDSKIFHFHNNELSQLSVDDNAARVLLDMGAITKEEVGTHKDRHRLTQHLGIYEDYIQIEPHKKNITLDFNDRVLLCSDGLTDMADENDIREILKSAKSPKQAVASLMSLALENGGEDNITVMVIDYKRAPLITRKYLNVAATVLIGLVIAVFVIFAIVKYFGIENNIADGEIYWTDSSNTFVIGQKSVLIVGKFPQDLNGEVFFQSSDPGVLEIDSKTGYCVAKKKGKSVITATLGDLNIERIVTVE